MVCKQVISLVFTFQGTLLCLWEYESAWCSKQLFRFQSKKLGCLYCDFSVETVYSLAYGVSVKLAIVNLNMTTCKLVIQKLLLQPPLPPCSDNKATKTHNMSRVRGVKCCSSPQLSLPVTQSFLPKLRPNKSIFGTLNTGIQNVIVWTKMALSEKWSEIFSKCRQSFIIKKFISHQRLVIQARPRHSYCFKWHKKVFSYVCLVLFSYHSL